jgi:MFS family permease
VLALATLSGEVSLPIVYLMTAALSGLTAFDNPARSALLPTLVPENQIANAVRLNVVLWQVTAVLGPVVAGLLLAAFGPGLAYGFNALSFLPVVIWALWVRVTPIVSAEKREISFAALGEGLRFVRSTPLLWSSMLLDFFATFFSSALALLPIYATNILRVGAQGYGLLYAAPALGATAGAFLMAQLGSRVKRQGELMIWAVAGYGLSTIIFGLSNSFIISLIALACVGMTDSFSTVVRGALRQLLTPDRLRGRIISITLIFFQGGPQLGEFEAGVMARAFGAPLSVVSGGIGTLIAVGAIAYMVPTLRHYRESAPAEALAISTTPEPTPQISPP